MDFFLWVGRRLDVCSLLGGFFDKLEEQPVRHPFIMPEACQFCRKVERNVKNIVVVNFLFLTLL